MDVKGSPPRFTWSPQTPTLPWAFTLYPPHWLVSKERTRRATCFLLRRRLGEPCFVAPHEVRRPCSCAHTWLTHAGRQPADEQPLDLLTESGSERGPASALIYCQPPPPPPCWSNWPFSSSRESPVEDFGSFPQSRHLTPCVIHKTQPSQGWRLRGCLAQIPVCGVNHAKGSSRLCLHTSSAPLLTPS